MTTLNNLGLLILIWGLALRDYYAQADLGWSLYLMFYVEALIWIGSRLFYW